MKLLILLSILISSISLAKEPFLIECGKDNKAEIWDIYGKQLAKANSIQIVNAIWNGEVGIILNHNYLFQTTLGSLVILKNQEAWNAITKHQLSLITHNKHKYSNLCKY
jgi:hypothetical protein